MATFSWFVFLVIYVAGLILGSSEEIEKDYKLNKGMSLKEISDAYLTEFYQRIEEFQRNHTYKNFYTGKSKSLVDGRLPPAPQERQDKWSPVNMNDYVGGGNKVERLFVKREKFSTLPYNQPSKLESKPSENEVEVINTTLHLLNKPFFNFTVTSNRTLYEFGVEGQMGREYFISVVVEKMNCPVDEKMNNSTKLYIGGDNKETYVCKDIDSVRDQLTLQWVSHLVDGNSFVKVTGKGDWTTFGVSATLVASIYYETHSCKECEANGHFCCGRRDEICKFVYKKMEKPVLAILPEHYDVRKRLSKSINQDKFRCIPKEDRNGTSILCNGHPNCGFHCNLDELKSNCPMPGEDHNEDDNYCAGYYCRSYVQDRFLVTLLLLILFCVFLPFCIFVFLCGRRDFQRNSGTRGRCPLPLEIMFCPFSMSADSVSEVATTSAARSGHGSTDNQQRRRQQRGRTRRSDGVRPSPSVQSGSDNFSFFDDLPPSYSEVLSNKEMYPTPTKLAEQSSNPSSKRIEIPKLKTLSTVAPATSSERFPLEQIVRTHSLEYISQHERVTIPTAEQSPSDTISERATIADVLPDSVQQDLRTIHICQCRKHDPVVEEE